MRSGSSLLVCVALAGCGGEVRIDDGGGGAGGASASGRPAATSGTRASTGVLSSSATSAPVTYGGTAVYTEVVCREDGPQVFVEVTPGDDQCAPADNVGPDQFLFAIDAWDGGAGTFVLGRAAQAQAYLGAPSGNEDPTGTLVLEVAAPFVPVRLTYDVDDFGAGTLDLATCLGQSGFDPCRR